MPTSRAAIASLARRWRRSSGDTRTLAGTIILSQQGTSYTSTFDLETEIPTPEGDAAHAQVIGKGEGSLEDGALRGTAQTQIVWSEVPDMNSNFAFAPRRYGPRRASKSVARMDEKGTIEIDIESTGQPGETYRPTHTILKGKRVTARP